MFFLFIMLNRENYIRRNKVIPWKFEKFPGDNRALWETLPYFMGEFNLA